MRVFQTRSTTLPWCQMRSLRLSRSSCRAVSSLNGGRLEPLVWGRAAPLTPARSGELACRSARCLAWRGGDADHRLRLDLHLPARVEEGGDDHHRARGTDLAEDLSVDATDRLP